MVERAKFTATFSLPEASSVLSSPASAVSICWAVWLRSTTLSSVPQFGNARKTSFGAFTVYCSAIEASSSRSWVSWVFIVTTSGHGVAD